MPKAIKPGTDDQAPGTYVEVGPDGKSLENPRVIEIGPGDRLPPTQASGNRWVKK